MAQDRDRLIPCPPTRDTPVDPSPTVVKRSGAISPEVSVDTLPYADRHSSLKFSPIISFFLLFGCAGSLGNISATDPTERGLSYVACAIVTHAVLRFFSK